MRHTGITSARRDGTLLAQPWIMRTCDALRAFDAHCQISASRCAELTLAEQLAGRRPVIEPADGVGAHDQVDQAGGVLAERRIDALAQHRTSMF